MQTETTMGTMLEILAPYLPYGIEVETGIGRCRILDVNLRSGTANPISAALAADVENGAWSTEFFGFDHITPVLRSFADLCTPLADGTVAACEVARAVLTTAPRLNWGRVSIDQPGTGEVVVYVDNHSGVGFQKVSIWPDDWVITGGSGSTLKAYDYLRSKHFAVGLSADQFIRKTK